MALWKRPGTGEWTDLPCYPDHECQPGVRQGLEPDMVDVDVLQGIESFVLEGCMLDGRTKGTRRRAGRRGLRREDWKWHFRVLSECL